MLPDFKKLSLGTMAALVALLVLLVAGWALYFGRGGDLEQARARAAAAEQETASVQAELQNVRDQLQTLQAANGDLAEVEARTAETRAEAARLERRLTVLHNKLIPRIAAVNARKAQFDEVMQELAAAEAARDEAERAAADALKTLRAAEARTHRLERAAARANNRLIPMIAAIEVRRQQLDGLLDEVAANEATLAEIAAWKRERTTHLARLRELRRETTVQHNRLVALTAAAEARQTQVREAIAELDAAEEDRKAAELAAFKAERRAGELRAVVAEATAERERLERELVRTHNKLIPAIAAVEARQAQLREVTDDISEAEDTLVTLDDRIAAHGERLTALRRTVRAAAQKMRDLSHLLGVEADTGLQSARLPAE